MGGQIRVVYREENGTVHKRTRWTNRLGRFLKSHHVAERNHDHMMEYFGPDERIEPQRLSHDDHTVPLAPHQYGIVVVDFQANQFMATQNYTSLNRIGPAEATGTFYRPEHRAECIKNFTDMADHRLRVRKRVFRTFQKQTTHEDTLGEPLTRAEAFEAAQVMMREFSQQNSLFRERVDNMVEPEYYYDTNFVIDFDPLDTSLLDSDDDSTALLLIKQRMIETGFEFTAAENAIWDREIAQAMGREY